MPHSLIQALIVCLTLASVAPGCAQPGRPVERVGRRPPEATIERIVIRGNAKVRDKVIRGTLTFAEGAPLVAASLETSRRRLEALGFFTRAVLSTRPGSAAGLVDVTVEVIERPMRTLEVGVGFSSTENFIAEVRMSQHVP